MKKIVGILIMMALLTHVCFSAECWMNIPEKFTRWARPTTIIVDGIPSFNPYQSDENLIGAGYFHNTNAPDCDISNMLFDYDNQVIYQVFTETTNETIQIDMDTIVAGYRFAGILNAYFPDIGGITNRMITEDYITEFFSAKLANGTINAIDLGYATLLDRYFAVLKQSPYNPSPGTTWDFPFGQQTIEREIIRRYYFDGENKHYL